MTRIWTAGQRPHRHLRGGGDPGAPPDPARKPVERALRHLRRPAPHCPPGPGHARLHADRHPAHADRAAGAFPGLSHLCRPGGHERGGRPGDGLGAGRRAPLRARHRPPTAGTRSAAGCPAPTCASIPAGYCAGRSVCAPWCASSSSPRPPRPNPTEDTAFYRYGRLISRNEVGSEPSQFALAQSGWHAAMRQRRQARWPRALCWPRPRTTTSAARTRAPAWPC